MMHSADAAAVAAVEVVVAVEAAAADLAEAVADPPVAVGMAEVERGPVVVVDLTPARVARHHSIQVLRDPADLAAVE
jgi:hypothetical protein